MTVAASTSDMGIIGLGVMGQNLALNVSDHEHSVAVWNLEPEWVDRFVAANPNRKLTGSKQLKEFVAALERPRRILMMIKAGEPVDEMLSKLAPLLSPGDIVIDGGNSYFKDTQRREAQMRQYQVNFFGMGVSGGEEGARNGPSLMPGGARESWERMNPVLEAIAAKTDSGPCVTYVGPDGAGHFVKMVHNGIEYGDMQLIAETYDIMRKALGMSAGEIAEVFAEWNHGPLESYLIEITAQIMTAVDPETNRPLVDLILDKAGQKGTGKWTAQEALDLAVPIPTIAAAIGARVLSSMKSERVAASKVLVVAEQKFSGDRKARIAELAQALLAAKICSYAQGMSMIAAGSHEYQWNVSLREMARIWKGGCIIRARLLNDIMQAFDRRDDLPNLLIDDAFARVIGETQQGLRASVGFAQQFGIPVPAMSASLAYFDSYRAAQLPQNLTQAQRDFFGAHTYVRSDRPDSGAVHTDWASLIAKHGGGR